MYYETGVGIPMLKSGIVSVTFRKKTPREVADITCQAKLDAIEWGSDVHVPQGDFKTAREVRDITVSSGLEVASYGSYYYLGEGMEFEPFLESALALGTDNIRVWAGKLGSAEATPQDRERVEQDARNICDLASKENVRIATEYHRNTLTDDSGSCLALLKAVDRPNFASYWQPPLQTPRKDRLATLEDLLKVGKLANIHVYEYTDDYQRLALASGRDAWTTYFGALKGYAAKTYAMLEFVRDDSDAAFLEDAKLLRQLIEEADI